MTQPLTPRVALLEQNVAALSETVGNLLELNTRLVARAEQADQISLTTVQGLHAVMEKLEEAGLVAHTGEIITDLYILSEDVAMIEDITDHLMEWDEDEDSTVEEDTMTYDIESYDEDGPAFVSVRGGDINIDPDAMFDPSDIQMLSLADLLGLTTPTDVPDLSNGPVAVIRFAVEAEDEHSFAKEAGKQLCENANDFFEAGHLNSTDAASLLNISRGLFDDNFFEVSDPEVFGAIMEGGSQNVVTNTSADFLNAIFGAFLYIVKDGTEAAFQELIMLMVAALVEYDEE